MARRLRALERTGRCSGSATPGEAGGGSGPAAAAAPETGVRALGLAALGGGPADELLAGRPGGSGLSRSAPQARIEVKGEQQSSAADTPPELAPPAGKDADRRPPPAAVVERGGIDATVLLPALASLIALWLAARSVRRSLSGPDA